jgi:hypothetical protein
MTDLCLNNNRLKLEPWCEIFHRSVLEELLSIKQQELERDAEHSQRRENLAVSKKPASQEHDPKSSPGIRGHVLSKPTAVGSNHSLENLHQGMQFPSSAKPAAAHGNPYLETANCEHQVHNTAQSAAALANPSGQVSSENISVQSQGPTSSNTSLPLHGQDMRVCSQGGTVGGFAGNTNRNAHQADAQQALVREIKPLGIPSAKVEICVPCKTDPVPNPAKPANGRNDSSQNRNDGFGRKSMCKQEKPSQLETEDDHQVQVCG